jgi:hypothetical protein
MTEAEPTRQSDARTKAYYLLKDKGLPVDSGDYSMHNLYIMEAKAYNKKINRKTTD